MGIIIIFFISSNIEVNENTIDKINKEHLGEDVKLIGRVNDIFESEKVYFIELTQPSSITVLIFKNNKENLTLSKGDNIEIIGEIDEYEGKLEVIGNRIRVIN